jgi:hypothetical protein
VGWSNAEVILNPPRSAVIPDVPGVKIVVIAQP